MTAIPYELVPGFLETKRKKKPRKTPIWKLIDTRTGKTRCEMTNPQDVDCVIESLILADLLTQNSVKAGDYDPLMIPWGSLKF